MSLLADNLLRLEIRYYGFLWRKQLQMHHLLAKLFVWTCGELSLRLLHLLWHRPIQAFKRLCLPQSTSFNTSNSLTENKVEEGATRRVVPECSRARSKKSAEEEFFNAVGGKPAGMRSAAGSEGFNFVDALKNANLMADLTRWLTSIPSGCLFVSNTLYDNLLLILCKHIWPTMCSMQLTWCSHLKSSWGLSYWWSVQSSGEPARHPVFVNPESVDLSWPEFEVGGAISCAKLRTL